MPILFFVNCERTVLFSVKRDLDPPFTTLKFDISNLKFDFFWEGLKSNWGLVWWVPVWLNVEKMGFFYIFTVKYVFKAHSSGKLTEVIE